MLGPLYFALFLAVSWGFARHILAVSLSRRASTCFGSLGCFSTVGNLHTLPFAPAQIGTVFTLMSRQHDPVTIQATDDPSTWHSTLTSAQYEASKDTKVITHGYLDSGTTAWLPRMASELLKHGDYNVFIVDWGHGSRTGYDKAAANTLVVAAELAVFLQTLHRQHGMRFNTLHLIGHSLGAQISGNAGAKLHTVGRITGLDPAEPFFEEFDDSLRLDKSDAHFVDIIHTDGDDFNLLQGYGLGNPIGHVDFYPNGGVDQPGCTDSVFGGLFGALGGSQDDNIACSHSRSHEYFTESINSQCHFYAHTCSDFATYEKGLCHGCPPTGCPEMGFHANESSARGSYYLSTVESAPYCGHEYFVEMDLTGDRVNGYGRIYMTLLGASRNSEEIEFTRENRHYHANDQELHIVAVHRDLGPVTGVRVRFHRGDGLPSLGTSRHINVHRIVVEDAVSRQRTIFCTQDQSLPDDRTQTFRSHSGC